MTKRGFIYKYTYSNGKIYIGQTRVSVKDRHYQHMSASKDPSRWTVCEIAIAKYGEPTIETLETIEVDDNNDTKFQQLLNKAEAKWIKHFNSTTKSGKGYNVQEGGRMLTADDFILEEKFYEIIEKEQWEERTAYVEEVIDTIGNKLFKTNEKLTKEEQSVWYGFKFHEYWLEQEGKETTFNSYYKRNKSNPDWGDIPDEAYKVLHDKKASVKDRLWAEHIVYDTIMREAFKEHFIKDVQHTIWNRVQKKKTSIIREFYNSIKKR